MRLTKKLATRFLFGLMVNKMKIFNIATTNINNGQELADWIYNKLKDQDLNPDDINEGALITEACIALNWSSVPQVGGLEIEWDE